MMANLLECMTRFKKYMSTIYPLILSEFNLYILFQYTQRMQIPQQKLDQKNQGGQEEACLKVCEQDECKNQGTWTTIQQKKYIVFLQKYKKQLQNKQKRKNHKIFKEMALFIGSRDGIQCRSHHMKLLRTHSKIRRIINHFKKLLGFSPENQFVNDPEKSNSLAFNVQTPLIKKYGEMKKNEVEITQPLPTLPTLDLSQWTYMNWLEVQRMNGNSLEMVQIGNQVFSYTNCYGYNPPGWLYYCNSLF